MLFANRQSAGTHVTPKLTPPSQETTIPLYLEPWEFHKQTLPQGRITHAPYHEPKMNASTLPLCHPATFVIKADRGTPKNPCHLPTSHQL